MLDDLRLSDLRTFGLVIRHGGFSAAARASDTPQTTISKRISGLEEVLGVKLLHRTTRQVKLTDEGKRVYQWAQKLLESAADMGDELAAAKGEPHGPLRISASTRLGCAYVAPVLAELKKRHPQLDISLEIVDRRVDLLAEDFHLDVRTGEPSEPHLIGHRIFESSRILCAAPSYIERHGAPATLVDVRDHACILFKDRNEPLGVWRLKGPKGWESVDIQSDLASNDNEVVLAWAQRGLGIMFGTDWFFAESLETGSLQRVLPDWQQPADVWAVSASRAAQSAKVRVFIECLKDEMRRLHRGRPRPE
jgi:LysR family transcriptional regulator, transcriptional activator for dmlA